MVILRVFILIALCAYSWEMGQSSASELNDFGKVAALSFFVFAPLLYFYPTIEAVLRKQPNKLGISLLNIFLGWTLIGWVTALVWACKNQKASPIVVMPAAPSNNPQASSPAVSDTRFQSTADELKKLSDLKAAGILTEEEFQTQKSKLLR